MFRASSPNYLFDPSKIITLTMNARRAELMRQENRNTGLDVHKNCKLCEWKLLHSPHKLANDANGNFRGKDNKQVVSVVII